MQKLTIAALLAGSLVVATACGPQSSDFKREAERLIEADDGSRLPMDYDAANCDEPPSRAPGTTFRCSAVGSDGANYAFETRITSGRKFVVTLAS